MYLDPTLALARSHTDELRASAARHQLARLATCCRSSRAAAAARSVGTSVRQVAPRTLHWLRAGQLQAPCSC